MGQGRRCKILLIFCIPPLSVQKLGDNFGAGVEHRSSFDTQGQCITLTAHTNTWIKGLLIFVIAIDFFLLFF